MREYLGSKNPGEIDQAIHSYFSRLSIYTPKQRTQQFGEILMFTALIAH